MDERGPNATPQAWRGMERRPTGGTARRRHAAARSRIAAGALSIAAFLGLASGMAARAAQSGATTSGSSKSSISSSSSSSSSSDDTSSSDQGTIDWGGTPSGSTGSSGQVSSGGS
jgi:hypothetical protein